VVGASSFDKALRVEVEGFDGNMGERAPGWASGALRAADHHRWAEEDRHLVEAACRLEGGAFDPFRENTSHWAGAYQVDMA